MRISDWNSDVCSSDLPFAVILTQVPHQGGEGDEARAGFAAKGVAVFDSVLHFRKDFYKATPIGKTAIALDPDSKAAAELRAAYAQAKRLSGYANKPIREVEIGRASSTEKACQEGA